MLVCGDQSFHVVSSDALLCRLRYLLPVLLCDMKDSAPCPGERVLSVEVCQTSHTSLTLCGQAISQNCQCIFAIQWNVTYKAGSDHVPTMQQSVNLVKFHRELPLTFEHGKRMSWLIPVAQETLLTGHGGKKFIVWTHEMMRMATKKLSRTIILLTCEMSFTMCGAAGVIVDTHQTFRLQQKPIPRPILVTYEPSFTTHRATKHDPVKTLGEMWTDLSEKDPRI